MKAGVLSKLASQVAEYYEVTYNIVTTTELKNVAHKRWSQYCEFKMNIFKAIAHYEESRDCLAQEHYGEQIGRLRAAYSLMIACQTAKLQKQVPEMNDFFAYNLTVLGQSIYILKHDEVTHREYYNN